MRGKKLALWLSIFLLACVVRPTWGQESAGLKRIRIGMPNRGATTLGLMAAQTYGLFRSQGLFAELIVMRAVQLIADFDKWRSRFFDGPCFRRPGKRERAAAPTPA